MSSKTEVNEIVIDDFYREYLRMQAPKHECFEILKIYALCMIPYSEFLYPLIIKRCKREHEIGLKYHKPEEVAHAGED